MKKEQLHNSSDSYLAKWLEGEFTDVELKHLVSEQDYDAYLKLRKGLEISEQLNRTTDQSLEKINQRISEKQPKVRSLNTNWLIGVAASIVVLFGLFMFLDNDDIILKTGYGESNLFVLLDGSEVILNSKSTISYNKDGWEDNRQLILDGEAYFKVAKGKTFTVTTTNGSVTVLGTQFNVNSTDDFFEVVCYEGKVAVNIKGSEHILLPSNTVRKINGNRTQSYTSNDLKPSWIDGESTFKSVPLRYVITALEEQYNVQFNADDIDENTVFSGSFPHGNLNIALQTVFDALDISYNEKEKRNIKLRY